MTTIREGIDFLNKQDHVDVVVTEAFLENESVFDFLKDLRAKPDHRDVPIILVADEPTHVGQQLMPSIEYTAKLLGAYKFLYMPKFDGARLLRELDATLPRGRLPKKEGHPEGAY